MNNSDISSVKSSKYAVLGVIYLAYIGIGLPNSLLGAAWPAMYEYVGVPLSYAGGISLAISLGMALASFFSERILIGIGYFKGGLFPLTVIALALFGFSLFRPFYSICILGLILGIGIGMNESSLNGIVVKSFSAIHMNWMHCTWGLGSAAGPVIMAWTISAYSSWKLGYQISGGILVAITAIFLLSLPFWKKAGMAGSATEIEVPAKHKTLGEIFSIPGAKAAILSVFFYCSTEMTIILWGTSYMVFFKDIDKATAAGWLALFYVGMTLGRFFSGLFSLKLTNNILIKSGQVGILLGAIILLTSTSSTLLAGGMLVLGLGSAPIFPSLLLATAEHFDNEFAQAILSMELTAAFLGNAFVPLLFGGLAAMWGYGIFPVALLITLALFVVSVEAMNRITRKHTL
jgi:fucose permease